MISVAYHVDLKEVQSDEQLARLLGGEEQVAPFDRLAWWQGLTEHCALKPLLAIAREGTEVAVLPLSRQGSALHALSNWYTFRWRPVCSSAVAALPLLSAIARDLRRQASRVTLFGIPDEAGDLDLVTTAFRSSGWLVFSKPCDTNHILHVNGRAWAEYLAGRPGPLRTTLKRKGGKVRCEIHAAFDPGAWEAYEAIYRESWKPSEGSPAFLRDFAEAEGKAGRLRLAVAYAGTEPVAAQLWTVEGNTAFIHKLAHTEASKPLSPGTTLSAALFEQVIDRDKVTLVDFGTGDDRYKRDWMEDVRMRHRLDILKPQAPRNWPIIARRALSRLAASAKRG